MKKNTRDTLQSESLNIWRVNISTKGKLLITLAIKRVSGKFSDIQMQAKNNFGMKTELVCFSTASC